MQAPVVGAVRQDYCVHNVCREGITIALPSTDDQAKDTIKNLIAVLGVDGFQGRNSADVSRRSLGGNLHTIGLHQVLDHKLILVLRLQVCHEYLVHELVSSLFLSFSSIGTLRKKTLLKWQTSV